MMKQKSPKMKMMMRSMMTIAFLMLHQPKYSNADSGNPLCDHISSARIDLLKLQSFTYLDGKQDKVYLMEGNQFYEMSDFTKDGASITPLAQNLWDQSPMMKVILNATQLNKDSIDMVTVVPTKKAQLQGYREYSGVVRTTDKIYAIPMKQILASGIITLNGDVVNSKNEHPHFSIIPKDEDLSVRGYVLQDDQFHNTNSSVVYDFDFDIEKKPKLATTETQNVFHFLYLVANKTNPDHMNLNSTWEPELNMDELMRVVKDSPLLHKTAIGFITKEETLYLIEPVIGCVYIVDAFPTSNVDMKLTRKPIEQFLKCQPSIDLSNEFLQQRYPPKRCDTVENVQHFFDNPPTPPTEAPSPSSSDSATESESEETGESEATSEGTSVAPVQSSGNMVPIVVGVIVVLLLVAAAIGALMYLKGKGKAGGDEKQSKSPGKKHPSGSKKAGAGGAGAGKVEPSNKGSNSSGSGSGSNSTGSAGIVGKIASKIASSKSGQEGGSPKNNTTATTTTAATTATPSSSSKKNAAAAAAPMKV